jgi:uncharacterized membrane protein YqjE
MTNRDEPRKESIFGLARQLVGGFVGLAKLEIQHGRQEMGQSLSHAKGGAISFALTAGLAILALFTLLIFIVLALAALTGWPGWLWALIVFVVLGLLAALFGWRGYQQVRQVKVKPDETIASVKEDIAWAKRLIRRE